MKKKAKWIVGITSVATLSGTLGLIQMNANAPTADPQTTDGTADPNQAAVQAQQAEGSLPFDYAVGVKKDFPSVPYYISDVTSIQGLTEAEIEDFFKQREAFLASLDWGNLTSQGQNGGGNAITSGTPTIKSGTASTAPKIKSDRRTRGSRR